MFNFLTSSFSSSEISSEVTSEITSETTSSSLDWNMIMSSIWNWITTHGIKLIIGLLVLFIGFKIINFIAKRVNRAMVKKNSEKTLVMVVDKAIKYGLKFVLLFIIISYVGIDTAGIGAIISSLGIGLSLAVQGSLSNLAGGIVILIMKPFRIGDYINAQGCSGTVEEIKMFYTYLVTPDNKVEMIPNGVLANDVIVNVTAKNDRRVDFVFSVAYGTDTNKAKDIILEVINTNSNVYKNPEPFIKVNEFGDSSINIVARVWCKKEVYWDVFFDLNDRVYHELMNRGIEIPFNQLDVNIKTKN